MGDPETENVGSGIFDFFSRIPNPWSNLLDPGLKTGVPAGQGKKRGISNEKR